MKVLVLPAQIAVVGFVLLVWQLVSYQTDLVPGLPETTVSLIDGLIIERSFLPHLWSTISVIVFGVIIAGVAGVATALALGLNRFLNTTYGPVLNALFAIPRLIVYPVFIAGFGVTDTAKLWTAVFTAYFPIAVNGIAGVRSINGIIVKLGRSLSCSPWQMIRHIYVPAAAPSLLVAARIAWSGTFLTVIGAEMFAAREGLGQLLFTSYGLRRYPQMFALAVLIVAIALAGNLLLVRLERRIRMGG